MKPYKDKEITHNEWYRTFDITSDTQELVWHRDRKDRVIQVLSGKGWKFQFDNEIPFDININDMISIKSMVFHRIIKGKTPLILRIKEE